VTKHTCNFPLIAIRHGIEQGLDLSTSQLASSWLNLHQIPPSDLSGQDTSRPIRKTLWTNDALLMNPRWYMEEQDK
jgi:hypothetical protein